MTIDAHWPQLAGAGLVARYVEPTAELEAEFVQLGRNLVDRCEATFYLLLAAQTSDPLLVAAAERGRQQALEQDEATP